MNQPLIDERLLMDLLKAKLEIGNNLIQIMPTPIRVQAESIQRSLLRTIVKVAQAYEAEHPAPVDAPGLKSVPID